MGPQVPQFVGLQLLQLPLDLPRIFRGVSIRISPLARLFLESVVALLCATLNKVSRTRAEQHCYLCQEDCRLDPNELLWGPRGFSAVATELLLCSALLDWAVPSFTPQTHVRMMELRLTGARFNAES
jgi:hypothetical protein